MTSGYLKFDQMIYCQGLNREVVSHNAAINACAKGEQCKEALPLLEDMIDQ